MGKRYVVKSSPKSASSVQPVLDQIMQENPTGPLFGVNLIPEVAEGSGASFIIVVEVDDA